MRIGWFGSGAAFPSERLLQLLKCYGEVWAVCMSQSGSTKNMQTMTFDEWLRGESEGLSIVVVTQPLWARALIQSSAHIIVVMTDEWPTDVSSQLCTRLLFGAAEVIVTTSERTYLEQCFRRDGVFLWQGDDRTSHGVLVSGGEISFLNDYEALVQSALQRLAVGADFGRLSEDQWQQRIEYYQRLLMNFGDTHETIRFLIASYKYLLHQRDAADDLLQSFQQMVVNGGTDCLRGQYRFLSAMQIQNGRVEEAIQTYGITAIHGQEQESYYQLLNLYNAGEERVVVAELYHLNDDLKSARSQLENPKTHLERHMLVKLLIELGCVRDALCLVQSDNGQCGLSTAQFHWLTGYAYWLDGLSFAQMNEYLLAVDADMNMISAVHDWVRMEEDIDAFEMGDCDGVATRS